ncbi:MAG: GntR family transcriptional regulator [Cloacibacillus sp.]
MVNDIYISLKQDILWLRLKPKTMLTESLLADIYKTSKTPIREALSMLVRDELVSIFPRKGYMVTDVSLTDMRDMHQYRYILENANLVYAVKNATQEQLEHLDALAEKDRYYTEEVPHFSKEAMSNNAFHFYLAEMTGNRILLKQLTDTLEKLQRIMYFVAEKNYMFRGCEEHHQLVRHIANKELEKAQIVLHHHISEVLEHISQARAISKLF